MKLDENVTELCIVTLPVTNTNIASLLTCGHFPKVVMLYYRNGKRRFCYKTNNVPNNIDYSTSVKGNVRNAKIDH